MWRIVLFFLLLLLPGSTDSAAKRPLSEVDLNEYMTESQVTMTSADDEIALVWWIPAEYWAISVSKNDAVSQGQADEMMSVLRPYSILAIVQADVGTFGSFSFYSQDAIAYHATVTISSNASDTLHLNQLPPPGGEIQLLVETLKPILKAAMGNMGQNMHFFILSDVDAEGNRIVDPYSRGELQVSLRTTGGNTLSTELEMPFNSLFVPRKCPNGKDAHVSWNYCPWTGTELED